MKLEIRLFAGLKCNNEELESCGKNVFYLEVDDEISLEKLHRLLKIHSTPALVNLVNGISRPKDWVLKDQDRVGIFPPIGGG